MADLDWLLQAINFMAVERDEIEADTYRFPVEIEKSVALVLAAGTALIGKVQPFSALLETGLVTLIDDDEQVDQDDYGASAAVAFGEARSGEFLHFTFISLEGNQGAIQEPAGTLLILDADPSTSAGDVAITAGERATVIGQVDVTEDDWQSDANGASACIVNQPIAFHSLENVYFLWFHSDATSYNDGAGDDETLQVNAWYRRDS